MRCVDLGHEILVYDNSRAGILVSYRPDANHGINIQEDRKLTSAEIDELIMDAESLDGLDSDSAKNEQDITIIEKIIKLHPEVKYLIHGYSQITAKSEGKNLLSDLFGGFKGMLHYLYKGLFTDELHSDAEDREELRKYLKNDFQLYQKNKKFLEKNKESMKGLEKLISKKEIDKDDLSLILKLVNEDPVWAENLNFKEEHPTFSISLDKFFDFEVTEKDEETIMPMLKSLLKTDKKISIDYENKSVDVTTSWDKGLKMLKDLDLETKDLVKPIA